MAIYGDHAAYRLRRWIEAGGIFDCVCLGNSRIAFGGRGIIWGMQQALGQILPQYSTGLSAMGQHSESGTYQSSSWANPYGWYQPSTASGVNKWFNAANVGNPFTDVNCAAWAERMCGGLGQAGLYYQCDWPFYYLGGSAVNTGAENGVSVPSAPLNTNSLKADENIRGYFYYSADVPGGGTFEPGFDSFSNSHIATCGVQTLTAASPAVGNIAMATCTAAAGTRAGGGIIACWSPRSGSPRAMPTGVLLIGHVRVCSDDRVNGWAVHRGWNLGGNSINSMAESFNKGAPTPGTRSTFGPRERAIDYMIRTTTEEQLRRNQRPRLRVVLNEFQNTRNASLQTSVPSGLSPGDSADAAIDSMSFVVEKILSRWCNTTRTLTNGTRVHFGEDDIVLEVHTEHVQSSPNDAELDAYAAKAIEVLPGRFGKSLMVVDDRALIPYAELNDATTPLYNNAPSEAGADDTAHLKQVGEEILQQRTLARVRSTANPDLRGRPRSRIAV